MEKFDVVVLGAGPGGYVAAIKAAQFGKRVALIDKGLIGGTCLNRGCIPTKTLIAHSELLEQIKKAEQFGIHTGEVSFDFSKMKGRKDNLVGGIRKSLEGLIKKNGITILIGTATFLSPREIKITGEQSQIIHAEHTIIATGSEPLDIPAFPCDHQSIFNSTSILELTKLPKSIAIIGGGYIGCEFASLYLNLGVEVIILEALPSILTTQPPEIAKMMHDIFVKKGAKVLTGLFVEGIDKVGGKIQVRTKEQGTIDAEIALVSVGRSLNTRGIGLEKAGVAVDARGVIPTNEKMQTNVEGIYAIGDVTGKWMLAHVASHQGIVAASNCCGHKAVIHYEAVPAVVFTHPEIATVGLTLQQALEKGYAAKSGSFPFVALGKSQAIMETTGFAQIVTDSKTGQILGAQVIGHDASNLIAEMALAVQNELTLECLIDTIHAHPTNAEAWLEAALVVNDTPIHLPPKIKKT